MLWEILWVCLSLLEEGREQQHDVLVHMEGSGSSAAHSDGCSTLCWSLQSCAGRHAELVGVHVPVSGAACNQKLVKTATVIVSFLLLLLLLFFCNAAAPVFWNSYDPNNAAHRDINNRTKRTNWLEHGANNAKVTGLIPIWAIYLRWTWWSLLVPSNSEYSVILVNYKK